MAIKFNKLVSPGRAALLNRSSADSLVRAMDARDRMVFMSHKSGDHQAEGEAQYIMQRHGVAVYMVEWDDHVDSDSTELPDYIMTTIRRSSGFLVNVTAQIAVSMWIGYEIGGAHAMGKSRAKIMYSLVPHLPSVVAALDSLRDRFALDQWITTNVLSHRIR
jgi:hypothetical protein